MNQCNKPKDQARINRNAKKFKEAKKKGKSSKPKTGTTNSEKNGSGKGIWIPPSAHEAKFGNKRLILGEVRVYDATSKKWNLEQKTQTEAPRSQNRNGNGNPSPNASGNQSGNAGRANSAGIELNAEQEALIDMHIAQFKSNMRSVFK